jgi:ketosteroid isomerase-like protein
MRLSFIFALILMPFLSFGQVTKELSDLTNQWSEAISNQDLRTLSGMYAENVVLYGKTTTRKGM